MLLVSLPSFANLNPVACLSMCGCTFRFNFADSPARDNILRKVWSVSGALRSETNKKSVFHGGQQFKA